MPTLLHEEDDKSKSPIDYPTHVLPNQEIKSSSSPREEHHEGFFPVIGLVPITSGLGAIPSKLGEEDLTATRLSSTRTYLLATAMMLTVFVGAASNSAPTILIPVMARDLGQTVLETQWVSSAYAIAFACGMLVSGSLSDIYGRRKMYIAGVLVFAVFAIITGSVKNIAAISVTRAIAGLGLATAIPAGFGVIGVTIKEEPARTRVFAAFGLGNPVGAAVGNLIGGAIGGIRPGSWSYVFYFLAGLSVLVLIVALFVVPPDPKMKAGADRRIDWIGGGLISSAICLFTFSLTDSGIARDGWRTPYIPALLVLSIILLGAFVYWTIHLERRAPTATPAILKLSLFKRHNGLISIVCVNCFLVCLSVVAWIYSSTIFYQEYKHYTPLQNSIATLPSTVVGVFAALSVTLLAPRVEARHLLGIGAALTGGCSVLYATWPEGLTFWAMEFPAQIMIPWGIDLTFVLGNILISNLVEENEQSVAGALFQTCGALGSTLGICVTALIVGQIGEQKHSILEGCRAGFWWGAVASLLVSASAYVGFRKVGLAKDAGKARAEQSIVD